MKWRKFADRQSENRQSNKYLAGTFKNLYSDHRSLFLRIPTDINVIPFSPPIHDNP